MKLRSLYEFLAGLKLGTPTVTDIVTTLGNPGADTKLATEKAIRAGFEPRFVAINRYGFVNNAQTALSFDGTDTIALTDTSGGTGWSYMRAGILYTISGTKGVTLSTPMADGVYYFFINDATGGVDMSFSPCTLQDTKVPVAVLLWKSACTPQYWLADERHTCLIDRRQHYYEHTIEGTRYLSGGLPSGYTTPPVTTPADSDNLFGISETFTLDEDLSIVAAELVKPNGTATDYVIFYRTAASTWLWAASATPFRYTASGYIQFDAAGTMTEGQANKFYNTYLLYTNLAGAARFVLVHGRSEFATLAAAQAESPGTFSFTGIGINEFIIAYQFTWETKSNYTTKGLCRLAALPVKRIIGAIQTTINATGNHNALAGLQGGTVNEYYHLTVTETGKLVTNGDTHDHNGGDGAQISHTNLSNIGTNTHAQIDTALATPDNLTPCGRLTLTTGVPVTTADVTAATTLYYAPFEGNRLPLYNGSAWAVSTFTELSLSLSGATADKNNDIFVYDNGGTLTLEKVEWTNDTTRATALAYQDGIAVNSGAARHRYLGTIRTTGTTGQCEDSTSKRFVWNAYHRRERVLRYTDSTASWTYASQTWRQLRGQSAAQVACVIGLAEDAAQVAFGLFTSNAANIGIGVNSTTTPSVSAQGSGGSAAGHAALGYAVILPIGATFVAPLERALTACTSTFYGTNDSQPTMHFNMRILA